MGNLSDLGASKQVISKDNQCVGLVHLVTESVTEGREQPKIWKWEWRRTRETGFTAQSSSSSHWGGKLQKRARPQFCFYDTDTSVWKLYICCSSPSGIFTLTAQVCPQGILLVSHRHSSQDLPASTWTGNGSLRCLPQHRLKIISK